MSWNQGNYIIKGEEVKVKGKVRRKVVTQNTTSTTTTNTPKWTGKSAASHIRALIASMSEEEKKALEEGEKFGLGF
jgi:hypothetical protein